ncbi:hypothetical protein MCUN1_000625 [Malassezia cuniculi]|uniref:U three protein 23 n=1 Tax=Malassezia cuniculi TaxID=948313 RepID=A0AAF0EPB2_9BASI|nr:hypothetical protein MCUN1_000625 [Malassezia cuniculi]
MRQKRAKAYKRLLHQYVMHYGFREPWQVLIDNTFADSLVRYKVEDPMKQVGTVLDAKVKPMITQCCMEALYAAERSSNDDDRAHARKVIALAKGWERRMCNHKQALEPGVCLESVIGATNKHRYVLAADDVKVRRARRAAVPGLPILHYSSSVLVLEPMSTLTEDDIQQRRNGASAVSAVEKAILKKEQPKQAPEPPSIRPKRKRAKGPNPLSCA